VYARRWKIETWRANTFTLNNNKVNVALGSTHLWYNAQHEKKKVFFIIPAQGLML
jgi:hypothetical protein